MRARLASFFFAPVALGVVLSLAACQAPPEGASSAGGSSPSSTDVGSVTLELTLGGTFRVDTIHYEISGHGLLKAADVAVTNAQTFKTLVGGIPFGAGYVAKISFQDVDHRLLPCQGSATFDVSTTTTISVPVHLACKPVPTTTTPPPPSVPVPRGATLALGALLLAFAWRRARATLLVATASLSFAASGCDAAGTAETGPGAVTMALEIVPGTNLDTVDYRVDGPGSFVRTGTIDVSHSSTLSVDISPLPPGTGFQIALQATSREANARCLGMATFDVAARATTPVVVHLLCQQMARNGTASVNGALNVCPMIDSFAATPDEVLVGTTISLASSAHDLDGGPSLLTYQWTASGGALDGATAPSPSFTCTASGPVTISLTVSDGDDAPGCPDARTLTVACTVPPGP
jgi:hypothetical protein